MWNKSLYVFNEAIYLTFMINCFTVSYISLLQDVILVILFNRISIFDTQTLGLFEGCLYKYRNTMVHAMFSVKLKEDKRGHWSSPQRVSVLEISQISLRNLLGWELFLFLQAWTLWHSETPRIMMKFTKIVMQSFFKLLVFYKWLKGQYFLLPIAKSKWEWKHITFNDLNFVSTNCIFTGRVVSALLVYSG